MPLNTRAFDAQLHLDMCTRLPGKRCGQLKRDLSHSRRDIAQSDDRSDVIAAGFLHILLSTSLANKLHAGHARCGLAHSIAQVALRKA